MNNIKITEHAYLRMKQRNGWSRKTADRMLNRIYNDGQRIDSIKGYLKMWIKEKIKNDPDDGEYVLYGKQVYIFRSDSLITVLTMPSKRCVMECYA